jgi:hypothetical protein
VGQAKSLRWDDLNDAPLYDAGVWSVAIILVMFSVFLVGAVIKLLRDRGAQ